MGKYFDATIVGIAVGGPYSLVGISLTLMFRTTGVLSFAHAAFAMIAGFVLGELSASHGWPVAPAAVAAIAAAVIAALITERVAMRPLHGASAPTKLIATLAVLSIVTGLTVQYVGSQPRSTPLVFPDGVVRVGDAAIAYQQVGTMVIAVLAAVGLREFLRRTQFGMAIRAVQHNADSAELLGISISRVNQFNWAIGGLLSGLVGVLLTPLIAASVATYPLVLASALTGTLFGGLVSLPLTFVGGVLVGVIESVATVAFDARGAPELAVMLAIPVLLVARRSWGRSDVDSSTVSTAGRRLDIARGRWASKLAGLGPGIRVLTLATMAVLILAGSVRASTSEYWGVVGALALFYAIEALSMVVLTGWAGQVSLMHGAYVGIGTFITGWLVGVHGLSLVVAIPLAGLLGVAMGALLGVPALRLDGVQFAIASTVFAAAATAWLFELPDLPRNMNRGTFLSIDLFDSGNLFAVMLGVTCLLFGSVAALRRSTWWRLLIASRDTPVAVRHAGLNPGLIRLGAFCLASFIATVGGAFFGIIATSYSPFNFSILLSFTLLLYAVVGGLETLIGPVVAAMAFGVLPQVLQQEAGASGSSWPEIVAGVIVIVLLIVQPGGLGAALTSRTRPGTLRFGRFDHAVGLSTGLTQRSSPGSAYERAAARGSLRRDRLRRETA